MYQSKRVSVVLGTYREKRSIKKVIDSFFATGFVDEVVVVNNNAEPGTDEEVKKTKARIVYEPRQGYGYAYQTALKEAKGDYIITTEADDTFRASDIERFLVYAKDFEVVIGTRTSQIGSLSGAGMGVIRKFANVIEAKTIEVLFNTFVLTDVGCTYKLFHKTALQKLISSWTVQGSPIFNTELTLLVVSQRMSFVEVPITYSKRVGQSAIVGTFWQTTKWAIFIQIYIILFWLKWILFKK